MSDFGNALEPLLRILLLMCRTGSFLAMTPLLRRLPVPPTAGAGIALLVTIVLDSAGLGPDLGSMPGLGLLIVIAMEVAIGLALGVVTLVVFEGFRLAGQVIGYSMGMSMSQLLDPGEKSQMSTMSVWFGMFAALLFVLMDGHHMLLRTLVMSYRLAPIGTAQFPAGAGQTLVSLLAASFALGVRIAAPVLAGQLLTDMTAGILGRSIPRSPVFFISLPVKMLVAYGVTILVLPVFGLLIDQQMTALERSIVGLLRGM